VAGAASTACVCNLRENVYAAIQLSGQAKKTASINATKGLGIITSNTKTTEPRPQGGEDHGVTTGDFTFYNGKSGQEHMAPQKYE